MMEYMALFLQHVDEEKAKSWSDKNKQIADETKKWYEELRETYRDDINNV